MVVQKGGEVTQLCANIDKLPLLDRRKYAEQKARIFNSG